MPFPVVFDIKQEYDSLASGITIETILVFENRSATVQSKIDPGAQVCLFQREIGEKLGIDINSGHPTSLDTLTSSLSAFGHWVKLSTSGIEFDSLVYFAADYGLRRNLLGREGWLQKIKLAIVDYDSTIFLSPYDQST